MDYTEGKIKHLEFIENAIDRMGRNSFVIKGWAITLISAILFFSIERNGSNLIILALFPAIIFWYLDGFYLKLERLLRKLYDKIRLMDEEEWLSKQFIMNIYLMSNEADSWFKVCFSTTILWVYLPIIILILVIWINSKFDLMGLIGL